MSGSIFAWIVEQPFRARLIPGVVLLGVSGVLHWCQITWMWGWIIGAIALVLGLLAPVLGRLGLID